MSTEYLISFKEPKRRLAEKTLRPRPLRERLRLNQQEFSSAVGVTQSGGSRYENGRSMPKQVRELVRLVNIEGINLTRAWRAFRNRRSSVQHRSGSLSAYQTPDPIQLRSQNPLN